MIVLLLLSVVMLCSVRDSEQASDVQISTARAGDTDTPVHRNITLRRVLKKCITIILLLLLVVLYISLLVGVAKHHDAQSRRIELWQYRARRKQAKSINRDIMDNDHSIEITVIYHNIEVMNNDHKLYTVCIERRSLSILWSLFMTWSLSMSFRIL